MSISPKTTDVHHIALRCSDMNTTKNFYQNTLGLPPALDTPDLMGFVAGNVFFGFRPASPKHAEDTTFNPFNIGMDHLALAAKLKTNFTVLHMALKMQEWKIRE